VTTLNSFEDISNCRLRRCVNFPNQTFFGLIADEEKKSEKQPVKRHESVRMRRREFKRQSFFFDGSVNIN
jgi:hypothetical protein